MKHICMALIRFYRKYLSPLKREPCCRFTPTCSGYALEAFEKRGFFVGLILTVARIARCNPFCAGGYDPVPPKGLRNKREDIKKSIDDGGEKERFVFDYELSLNDRKEESKKQKTRED